MKQLPLLSPLWAWLNQQPWMRPAMFGLGLLSILTEKLAPPHTMAHQLAKELQGWLLVVASASLGTSHDLTPSLPPPQEPKTDEEAAQAVRDMLNKAPKLLLLALLGAALLTPRVTWAQEAGVYTVKEARLVTAEGKMFDVQGGAYYSTGAHLSVAKETIRLQHENAFLKANQTNPYLLALLVAGLFAVGGAGGYVVATQVAK